MSIVPHSLKKSIDKFVGPVFGHKTPKGCPRRYKNETYVKNFNSKGWTFLTNFKPPHGAYNQTGLKVTASLETLQTLLYLDFDTHLTGTREAVIELYRRVRIHFPQLPPEIVDDRGGSNWLVIDTHVEVAPGKVKCVTTHKEYNEVRAKFQDWLRELGHDLDIEFIEGLGDVYEPTMEGRKMKCVRAGHLIKVPPAEEYLAQTPVKFADLKALVSTTSEESTSSTKTPQAKESKKERTGSFRPRIISDEKMKNFDNLVNAIDKTFPDRPMKAGRYSIWARQFAEILIAITQLPANDDGSNPHKRHEKFINRLQEDGYFQTRYQHERYKAVRDYLSDRGLIVWQDHTHTARRACKWEAAADLKLMVDSILSKQHTYTSTLIRTSSCIRPVDVTQWGILKFELPVRLVYEDIEGELYTYERKAA